MNKRKGVFCLLGASFRSGPQGSVVMGVPNAVEEQRLACQTHCVFLDSVIKDIDVKLVVMTYSTQYNDILKEYYDKYNPTYVFLDDLIGYENIFKKSVEEARNVEDADFYFFQRIDIILKQQYLEKVYFTDDKIMYPGVCWITSFLNPKRIPHHKTFKTNRHRVIDLLLHVPKKFFHGLYEDKIKLLHETCDFMDEDMYENTWFYLDTYHDSDSYKDRNPLYKIANRAETTKWYSEGHRLGENPIVDKTKTFANVFKNEKILE